MSLTDQNGNGMVMPVGPMYGGNMGTGWGDGSFWIIVLFLFALMGNGFGNGFGGCGGSMPYLMNNTQNDVQRGFDQQSVMGGINSLTAGISGVNQALCNGFAGVNATVNSGFANAETAANARQMADMQQAFAMQTALQNCCCENRAGIADLRYTIATENCADRQAVANALRDVIASNTANTQAILDKMCQQEIDALKNQNANLQTQLTMANLAASQNAQTATIQAGQRALANEVEQYVLPTPRPAYMVQNPNCCPPMYNGCGGSLA